MMPSAELVARTEAEPLRLRWAMHDVRDLRMPGRPAQPRLLVATALTVPVLARVAAPGLQFLYWQWLCLCLTAPVVIWGAAPFHRITWAGLRQGRITAAALVSLSTLAGLAWSAMALFVGGAGAPGLRQPLVPNPLADPAGGGQLYLGVAAAVTVCALVGRSLDWQAMRRTDLAASVTLPVAAADGRGPTPPAGPVPWLVGLYGTLILALAAGALGFWLAASGIVPLALQAATGVLIVAGPGGSALSSSLVWGLARSRLHEMGVQIHQPEALAVARRVDTMVVALGPREHLRSDAAGAIEQLNWLGVQPVVLSDEEDRASTAVQRLHGQGRLVARLGDGPGDLLIVANRGDDPRAHPDLWTGLDALRFCRRAHQIVRLNVVLTVLCGLALLPLAVTGRLNPTVAAAATVVSITLVVANSIRIRRIRASRPPAHRSRG